MSAESQPDLKDCGVIYVAKGARSYIEEALESARSVRKAMPGLRIALFTDARPEDVKGPVDIILPITSTRSGFSSKIDPLLHTPFDRTLFLDTDVHMAESCADVFAMLERFDLCVSQDPWRGSYSWETVPFAFATTNTGVIAYRLTPAIKKLILDWGELHTNEYAKFQSNDQPAFRKVLFDSQVRFLTLPPEYNLRTYHPCMLGGHMGPKILHERNSRLPEIASRMQEIRKLTGDPIIYGHYRPRLMFFYYSMKARRVLKRVSQRLFGLGKK
ncbi:MAG: hypothetical protein HZA92_01205 [Verrucomicrobia bacterium]|nr:hypothetical protein [Verrucomicrobiota bacterium]